MTQVPVSAAAWWCQALVRNAGGERDLEGNVEFGARSLRGL